MPSEALIKWFTRFDIVLFQYMTRQSSVISELRSFRRRFGHTGLKGTVLMTDKHAAGGWSCLKSETVEHILFMGGKYELRKLRNAKKNQLSKVVERNEF